MNDTLAGPAGAPAATAAPAAPKQALDAAVCTLFEGNYHYGVGALANSLYQHGFRGTLWAGYRGELPPWATPVHREAEADVFAAADGFDIRFVELDTPIFFANYKPHFMLDLWAEHCPGARQLFYFDPDIVTRCRWSFFEEWASCGVALCLDSAYAHMPSSHPFRHTWRALAGDLGYETPREVEQYYNSGFLGLERDHRKVLHVWKEVMSALAERGINVDSFKNFDGYNSIDRSHPFYVADQDALNVAVMATEMPLSVVGTDGMDFTGGGFVMSHAVDAPKPWQRGMVAGLLRGGGLPSVPAREYLRYIDTPIALYAPHHAALKRIDYYAAKAIGSLFHRH